MKNKFTWGTGIFSAIVLFMILVGIMVFIASRQDRSLVNDNYYPLEKEYAAKRIKTSNFDALGESVVINQLTDSLQLIFPSTIADGSTHGKISFYRPSDASLDMKFVFQADKSSSQKFPLSGFQKGNYLLIIDCEKEDVPYYHEKSLIIK
ncbi:MAG: FixH family protein [Bacteroidales bacterium]|jgi:hypothetical protein|nr:FixH family protein [Bacteroidales bacterium]